MRDYLTYKVKSSAKRSILRYSEPKRRGVYVVTVNPRVSARGAYFKFRTGKTGGAFLNRGLT